MREADIMIFINPLHQAGFNYMITGSLASMAYGEPRMTHDLDLVLSIPRQRVDEFVGLYPSSDFYCPPHEVIQMEIGREIRGFFNLISHQTGFKADIYPVGNDPLHHWAMARRNKIRFEQQEFWVAPPEYVIVRKLDYYAEGGSQKHLNDIQKMIRVSSNRIDWNLLQDKLREYKLDSYFNLITKD